MPDFEIGLADGSKFYFDQSFLQFNAKKNMNNISSIWIEMMNTKHC